MDKLRLNNEIVSLRKDAKRAKVHIIRKLIKNVKNLKKKLAADNKQGFQKKIDKIFLEITELKKLGADEISKFALKSKKTPGEILGNAESNSKERALARLVGNKIIAEWLDKIKKEFPNLDELLCNLDKNETKKRRKKKVKKNAKTGHVVQDDLSKSVEERFVNFLNNANDVDDSNNESDGDSVISDRANKKTTDTKTNPHVPVNKNIPSPKTKSKERKINTDNEQDKKPKTEKDSFFLTDQGEYESCVVKNIGSPELKNDKPNHIKSSWKNSNVKSKAFTKGQPRKQTDFSKKKSLNTKADVKNKNFKNKMAHPAPKKLEKIHPSWEAKKKEKQQQQSIHSFQGKKKKFSDE